MNGYELLNGPSFFLCFELSVTCPSTELRDKAEKNIRLSLKQMFSNYHILKKLPFTFFSAFLLNFESIFNIC